MNKFLKKALAFTGLLLLMLVLVSTIITFVLVAFFMSPFKALAGALILVVLFLAVMATLSTQRMYREYKERRNKKVVL